MDIAVTWPKTKPFQDYLDALRFAELHSLEINYLVAQPPRKLEPGDRCYIVYDGEVRGWDTVLEVVNREDGLVKVVGKQDKYWSKGWYIVRDPKWHPISPIEMKGFRGFRYVDFPDYFCGSNWCDDPVCTQDHAERL